MNNQLKKYNTRIIVAVMTVALLGLSLVQVHWITSAMGMSEDLFRQQVNEALANVARNLERHEAVGDAMKMVQVHDDVTPHHVAPHASSRMNAKPLNAAHKENPLADSGMNGIEGNIMENNASGYFNSNSMAVIPVQPAAFANTTANYDDSIINVEMTMRDNRVAALVAHTNPGQNASYYNSSVSANSSGAQGKTRVMHFNVVKDNNVTLSVQSIAAQPRRSYQDHSRTVQGRVWDSVVNKMNGTKVNLRYDEVEQNFNNCVQMMQEHQFIIVQNGQLVAQPVQPTAPVTNQFNTVGVRSVGINSQPLGATSPRGITANSESQRSYDVVALPTLNSIDNNASPRRTLAVNPYSEVDDNASSNTATWSSASAKMVSAEQHTKAAKPLVIGTDRVQSKIQLLQKTMNELGEFTRPLQERVNECLVDSMIASEFSSKGLPLDFNFNVVNGENHTFMYARNNGETAVVNENSPYKAALFPNDILQKNHKLVVTFPHKTSYILSSNMGVLFSSVLFVAMIVGGFGWTLRNLNKHKKVSEMKSDFINNMTHEFKTPIATIALATDALRDPDVSANSDRVSRFIGVIKEENQRLGSQVERVLQAARLERGELALSKSEIDINDIVTCVKDSIALQVDARGGEVHCQLEADYPFVFADEMHIRNIMLNLLDNANKYTQNQPMITITTRNVQNGVMISVEDNGIGISKENQKRIFEKLYRVPTGNVHNVKGFGLGLSYVQAIVEAHAGTVTVDSEIDKGSRFDVFLPYGNLA